MFEPGWLSPGFVFLFNDFRHLLHDRDDQGRAKFISPKRTNIDRGLCGLNRAVLDPRILSQLVISPSRESSCPCSFSGRTGLRTNCER